MISLLQVWEPMVSGSAAIAPNQKYLEWIARVWSEKVSTPENIKIQKIDRYCVEWSS